LGVSEGGMAAASLSLIVAILKVLRDNDFATNQQVIELFDAALLIMEGSTSVFPTDVQQSAERILAEMQDAFAQANVHKK
jgi:hypothetical protein